MSVDRQRVFRRSIAAAILVACCWPPGLADEDPLDVGLEEAVEVQLVLVDFIVLDRDDRTVPDLELDDFVLLVGGRETPLHSLDVDCPVGGADDPLPGKASRPLPRKPTVQPRRMVLVFDYYHMTNVAETFDAATEMLAKWPVGGEEHMVVSLGDVVRIESPFTSDPDEIRWTLDRMRNDPDLYAGNYGRLTERRFFDRVEVLFDLLERFDGRKTMVMFSGPFQNDGFFHDPAFKRLSGLATATRSAIYPVDTGGLRTPIDRSAPASTLGGPPMLRRLANETGGRMTTGTNEIGLAYAKAHRDLGCNYTAGFYDNRTQRDKKRRLTLRLVERPGLRIVYPEFYVVRSPEEKRKSLFRTATITPQMFESESMQTDLFVLEPRSSSRWNSLIAVRYRPGPETFIEAGERWELKAQLRKTNGTIVRSFKEMVPMPATDPAAGTTPEVTLFREIRLRPGRYVVSAVLSDPQADMPVAATRPAVIATVPRGQPFMVGPILGRTDSPGSEFEPLLDSEAERGEVLDALTIVCLVDSDAAVDVREIGRRVTHWNGGGALQFDAVSAHLDDESDVSCQRVLDRLPTAGLEPGRYELTAVAETSTRVTGRGTAEFTVLAPR